jgi:hypothetical protein
MYSGRVHVGIPHFDLNRSHEGKAHNSTDNGNQVPLKLVPDHGTVLSNVVYSTKPDSEASEWSRSSSGKWTASESDEQGQRETRAHGWAKKVIFKRYEVTREVTDRPGAGV